MFSERKETSMGARSMIAHIRWELDMLEDLLTKVAESNVDGQTVGERIAAQFAEQTTESDRQDKLVAERMDKLAAWIEEKKNDGKEITGGLASPTLEATSLREDCFGRYLQRNGPSWVRAIPARKREELREMMGYDAKWEKRV